MTSFRIRKTNSGRWQINYRNGYSVTWTNYEDTWIKALWLGITNWIR